jgi:hypothetical protein
MNMKNIAIVALTLLTTTLNAQSRPTPVEVTLGHVNDRRSSGSFSQLTIGMFVPSIRAADVAASRVLVSTAIDDTGHSLIDPEAREPELMATNVPRELDGTPATPPPPVTVSVSLAMPPRKAKTVKEVRGEIELYLPGKDLNSVAEIAKLLSFSGKPLTNKALKANGVDITLLNTAQIAAERKRLVDAKRKEAKANGTEGEELENMMKELLEAMLPVNEGELLVRLKDPGHTVQDMIYIDSAGETKHVTTRDEEGLTYLTIWGEKPAPDWKLKISMKTPKNVVRYTFVLKDVALP